MKTNMLKRGLIVMGVFCMIGSLFGCIRGSMGETGKNGIGKRAKDNVSGLTSFAYSYNGSIGGNSYSYTVKKENDDVVFSFSGMMYEEYGDLSAKVDPSILERLNEVYLSCRLAEWDGFSKYNSMVLDGDGFSLSLSFADGKHMSAHGSNAFPKRYADFKTAMETILQPLRDQVLEEARQKIIAKGIHGELSSVLVTFIQRGASGSDEYHVLIQKSSIRENNYDVQIKSRSGEFFPVGEHRYYTAIADDALSFPALQQLIEDCDLIQWYDYNKTAEDPDNAEWYQIALGFGDELYIKSYGTDHPVNYDQFRNGFLEWLKGTAEIAESLSGEASK